MKTIKYANSSERVMESETISKNEASPKSQMSRENFNKYIKYETIN
jgi:hypothetical protein